MKWFALFSLFALFALAAPAQAQVVVDAKSAAVISSATTANSMTLPLTVGSGTNRALAVLMLFAGSAVPGGLTATWDNGGTNQAMSPVAGTNTGINGGCSCAGIIYGLVAPTSGAHNLFVSWTANTEAHATAISFTGTSQASVAAAFPHGTFIVQNTSTAPPATGPVTSTVGNIVIAAAGEQTSTWGTINGTVIATDASTGPGLTYASNYNPGAATVNPSFGFGSASDWVFLATDVSVFVVAPPGGNPTMTMTGVGAP